jgi:hypothetical protein
MKGREPRPAEESHGWGVEIWSNHRSEWMLASTCEQGGSPQPAVWHALKPARAFRRMLHEHRVKGRRVFPNIRVRRVRLVSWGCAV